MNTSQMWNWSTRLFLSEARENLTASLQPNGPPSRYTPEELESLEKTLKEHESWLDEWVEKQKSVKMNEDPVILTTEMKARAKTLENQLVKLMRRRTPKPPKKSSSSSSSATSTSSTGTASSAESSSTAADSKPSPHDEL